jgi:succinate dehydrogenase/fumarate reductase-like Fe-S protein
MNKVKECIECFSCANEQQHATWEFYHCYTRLIQEIATASFDQNAKTAQQMVVVVVRKDLWRQRAQSNIDYLKHCTATNQLLTILKRKFALNYYQK